METRRRVQERYCKANGYSHDADVIYGDTDSVGGRSVRACGACSPWVQRRKGPPLPVQQRSCVTAALRGASRASR